MVQYCMSDKSFDQVEAKVVESTSLMMASFFLSVNVKIQAKISARQCTFKAQLLAGVVPRTNNRELSFGRVQRVLPKSAVDRKSPITKLGT